MRIDQHPRPFRQHGPETLSLLDALINSAILTNPTPWMTLLGSTAGSFVNPGGGAGTKLFTNSQTAPVLVVVRGQGPGAAAGAYLLLSTDSGLVSMANAPIVAFGEAPSAAALLRPGDTLWGDIITSASTAGFRYTAIPLAGLKLLYPTG